MNWHRLALLVAFLLSPYLSNTANAQPQLPDVVGITQKGINILSWTAQYDGIKSIAVQRSSDSFFNFTTIGYVKNLKKGPQGFIDGHPLPGKNWYRLYIAFNSDLTWYSNRFKIMVDSAQLRTQLVLPSNDSLQKLVPKLVAALGSVKIDSLTGKPITKVTVPVLGEISNSEAVQYIKSQYIFTNPFTGHVNVELPEVRRHVYSIRFFDSENRQIMEIPRVSESSVIIDKRNFPKKGLYKFELQRNKEQFESGYITIY